MTDMSVPLSEAGELGSPMRYQLYEILFPNGKRYIGVTSRTLDQRWKDHLKVAANGTRRHYPFYEALRKYGCDSAMRRTLVVGSRDYILDLEIQAIASLGTLDRRFGYNLHRGGVTSPMHSPEVAAKVSATKKRRLAEDLGFAALLARQMAYLQTPAVRAKNVAAIRTQEVSAAKSKKLKGGKHTLLARSHMSVAHADPANKIRRSISARAAWADPVLRAEQSARMKLRPPQPAEVRAKISATMVLVWKHRKAQASTIG
jgi:hypothetical protein